MLRVLSEALNRLALAPQEQKVADYLRHATPDSVLKNLHTVIAPNIRRINNAWTTFEASCIEDEADRQHYWTKESLKKHIAAAHPNVSFSNEAIDLLWRIFYFYACHPFPHYVTDASKIDFNGFQRAVTLLAHDATDYLGTQEDGDYYWRFDEMFFQKASFLRMLRSIGHLEESGLEEAVVDDVMDVLAITQPQAMKLMPSPDKLRRAARELLDSGKTPMGCRVTRRDLSTLLLLVLRMRLAREKWGHGDHYGTIGEVHLGDEQLAEALVGGLVGDKNDLGVDDLLRVQDVLPNLILGFHQLWKVLFQPPPNTPIQETAGSALPPRILSAISLFVSHSLRPAHCRPASQDTRIALQKSEQTIDMTASSLVKALQRNPRPKVILATDNGESMSPATVVGVFIPSLLYGEGEDQPRAGTSHLLFQLLPEFRLLRWTETHTPLVEFIKGGIDEGTPSLQAIEAGACGMSPYSIGDPQGSSGAIQIDPTTKSITFSRTAGANRENMGYQDMCIADKAQCEVLIESGTVDVYGGLFNSV
ncbi:uncharacterized protein BO80DRAFT_440678 [Aspergillus ibericus CBS 121593]|uniref:TLDc domain-containing protein n=1 Tax=Aspergillus ibericus CBS 121593 TaxID=1448316 RepID=A0A395HD84_9EURO|nr:hypothetical protein BO80DRAFT_440678 [Aspergillus ibericus CBS 121593]RAL05941.1 hypothetical protein BO80DRAFT_440678 [Aspergillus ibericus CBS 121593]